MLAMDVLAIQGSAVTPLGLSCVTHLSFTFYLAHMCTTGPLIRLYWTTSTVAAYLDTRKAIVLTRHSYIPSYCAAHASHAPPEPLTIRVPSSITCTRESFLPAMTPFSFTSDSLRYCASLSLFPWLTDAY